MGEREKSDWSEAASEETSSFTPPIKFLMTRDFGIIWHGNVIFNGQANKISIFPYKTQISMNNISFLIFPLKLFIVTF